MDVRKKWCEKNSVRDYLIGRWSGSSSQSIITNVTKKQDKT